MHIFIYIHSYIFYSAAMSVLQATPQDDKQGRAVVFSESLRRMTPRKPSLPREMGGHGPRKSYLVAAFSSDVIPAWVLGDSTHHLADTLEGHRILHRAFEAIP